MKKILKSILELLVFIALLNTLVQCNVLCFFEYPIVGVVFYLCISTFCVSMGVLQIKKDTPVGLFLGEKPPQKELLSDMKAWNKEHGIMMIVYGVIILALYAVCAPVGNIFASIIFVCVPVGALPIMYFYHEKLKKKYIKVTVSSENVL